MDSQNEKALVKDFPVPAGGAQLPSTEVRDSVPEFEDSADLRDYIEVLLRHKWLILTFMVGVFVTTLVVSLAMKPVFKARGRLELSVHAPKVTKFEDVSRLTSQLQTREFIQTEVKLLQSESLGRRVIEKLQLYENPVFNPSAEKTRKDGEQSMFSKLKQTIRGWLPSASKSGMQLDPSYVRLSQEQSVEKKFATSLEIQPERDTTIISLAFNCTDAPLARDVINTLIQQFIAWEVDKKIDAANTAKQQLEKQLEVARIQLEKAETNLNGFAQKAGIVSLDSKLNLVYGELEEINKALATSEAERIGKEALFSHAQKDNIDTMPIVLENPTIQKLKEDLAKAVSDYQELYAVFDDGYPKVKKLKARMVDLQNMISTEQSGILDSIRNAYNTALKKEESLRKEAERKKRLALELNDRATQYKILEREVETSKSIHRSLLERSKEIDANVGTELGKIQVVDYATLPLTPYKPNVRLNLLLALVVGLMGGAGLAFFLEYLDNTVKRIDEISDRFQIPVLGVLPVALASEVKDLDFIVRLKPKSSFSESIRTAKVSIQLSSSMDNPPKSILITSTSAGEGKSTISANLAQAFATSEERVILVDADLRKPRLHKIFSGDGNGSTNGKRKGLSQLLSGMCKLDEVVQRTDMTNLFFIAAGPIPPNPAELLASRRMKSVLDTLAKHFDRIIIDAPPAAGFADVLVLGNYVNGVILISTLGLTHREGLRIFRRSLYNVRGNLLGTVVNKMSVSHHYGGYYYKYYKYYHSYYTQPGTEDDDRNEETGRLPAETVETSAPPKQTIN